MIDMLRKVMVGGLATAALGAGLLPATAAYAAPVCRSGVPGDVNGDGYAEVAIGSPGTKLGRGAVNLFYGQATGLAVDATGTAPDDLYLTQDSPGIPGSSDLEDYFGSSTALGDFNHDGCADLAVGAAGDSGTGSVTILFGSPAGLKTTGVVRLQPKSVTKAYATSFGRALAAGDLNGDKIDDLALSISGLKVGKAEDAGGVAIYFGSSKGLSGKLSPKLITQATKGVPGTARRGDSLGTSLAIANVDGKGRNELIVGSSEDHEYAGSLQVFSTTKHGFAGKQPAPISSDTKGFPSKWINEFGTSIAAGDLNGDGYADVAVGAPETLVGTSDHGAAFTLLGSAKGITTKGSKMWIPGTKGVPGSAADEGVGYAVAIGRFGTDRYDDLVIGVPGTTVGTADYAGAVTVLPGGSTGPTTTGAQHISAASAGLPGNPAEFDSIGQSLDTARIQGGTQDSLLIGAPSRTVGGIYRVGTVWELPPGGTGPQTTGSRIYTPQTPGVQGVGLDTRGFGDSLSDN